MDTNRLRQFCTIVETRNLRKASELIGISHSGLSKSMKALEAELGFPILLPHGRGITISDAGMRLYRRSAAFFDELKRLLEEGPLTERPRLRLASFEVFTSFFIGEMLKEHFVDAEVEVHDLVPGKLEEALLLDQVDLGVTYEPIPRPGIEYVRVGRIAMGAFARADVFVGRDLRQVPFVVPAHPLEGAPSGVKGLDRWPEDRFPREIRYRVDLMATGLELARQGLCAIFIPAFVAGHHNTRAAPGLGLTSRPLPEGMRPISRDVFIVKRESTPESKAVRRVAQALRKLS